MEDEVRCSFKKHLLGFAGDGSYSAIGMLVFVAALNTALKKFPPCTFDIAWIAKAITVKGVQTTKGQLKNFFIYWKARYPNAIADNALILLSKTKTSGAPSGNVLSDDPEKSWLTDVEYDSVLQTIWHNYDTQQSGTQVTLMRLLSMQYARRPVQFSHLKIGDFQSGKAEDDSGIHEKRIRFPGAKDLAAETSFRNSKFEVHPVADHLWDLFQIQRQEVKSFFEANLKIRLTNEELNNLPVFCCLTRLKIAVSTFTEHYHMDWRTNLESELFHMQPNTASHILRWARNSTANGRDKRTLNVTPPISHRTGLPISVNATRMRHTRARQLARKGVPRYVLSHWLGHTKLHSLEAYYNDPAEDSRRLNEAMLPALMPLALAFAGKLIDSESQATRADDPTSRLEFANDGQLKNVGNCGKYSFCGTTSVPVPCYRCKHFEPLVYAPHAEVLTALLQRQVEENQMLKIGGQRNLLIPIDLSADIRAVRNCIECCNVRKAELGKI